MGELIIIDTSSVAIKPKTIVGLALNKADYTGEISNKVKLLVS